MKINKMITWQTPIDKPFERHEINIIQGVMEEQAFSREAHPDGFPITEDEQGKCSLAVEDFLRCVFSEDTGKWVLKTLHRDNGFIHASLKTDEQDFRVFQRKLLIIIDPNSFQAVNYMDNESLLEMIQHVQAPEKITIHKQEAFEKIRGTIELKPVYVYDLKQDKYILCRKMDSKYGVNASNGDMVSLDDL
ncbi:hypothetical protein [Peribacillus glennii]|uniref:hypothetical protein n=1 Tax=Peribacillus glennii TaxID=2303991 RepID=UPI001F3E985C|nr:hypothetical protein [Peribacillus glennii]